MVDFSQWPVVALVVAIAAPLLLIIRAQYETHIAYVKSQCDRWEKAASENTAILRDMAVTLDRLSERLEGGR